MATITAQLKVLRARTILYTFAFCSKLDDYNDNEGASAARRECAGGGAQELFGAVSLRFDLLRLLVLRRSSSFCSS